MWPVRRMIAISAVALAPWMETEQSQCFGQQSAPESAKAQAAVNWDSDVSQSIATLSETQLPSPAKAKEELQKAIAEVQQFVQPDTTTNGLRWLEFLRWKDLLAEVNSAEPDPDALVQLERNLRQNYSGLEMAPLVRLRNAIREYSHAVRYGSDGKNFLQQVGKSLTNTIEKLKQAPAGSDLERQRDIGSLLRILSESHQTPELVAKIRDQYSRANARVLVSREFMQRHFTRNVSQPTPVSENILGTSITGDSYLSGSVTPVFLPNTKNAVVRLDLQAQFSSDSRGVNRGVSIFTRGSAPVSVSETIMLTPQGLQSTHDTSVATALETEVVGIAHRSKLVRKIASKKVAEQQPLANAIGEQRLQTKLSSQFHQQVQEQLDQSNAKIAKPNIPELERMGVSKPTLTSWSSNDYLAVLIKQQEADQMAAPTSCPLSVERGGATIQIHQSIGPNIIDPVLSGRTIFNYEMDDLVSQFTKDVPAELLKEANEETWSISFRSYHPIELEFDDQLVKFRIRTSNLTKGPQTLEDDAIITATYRIVLENDSIQMIRQGNVETAFVGNPRGSRATVLRAFLKNKFDSVFKENLFEKPLRPLDRLPADAPKIHIASVQADDGWLQIHLH